VSWAQKAAATFDRLTFTKLAIDPGNPNVLFAGTTYGLGSSQSATCVLTSTGTSGVYKSNNGGETWSLRSNVGGLPAGGANGAFNGSAYDVAVDPIPSFTGPFSGTVAVTQPNTCTSNTQYTLTAVDSAKPADHKITLTFTPQPGGGFAISGSFFIEQNPAPPSTGSCDDLHGLYVCTGTTPDLRESTTQIVQCSQQSGPLFAQAVLVGHTRPEGSMTGLWDLQAGSNSSSM